MTTTAIRQQLHNYLDVASEKKVKAIFTMVEEDLLETQIEFSDEFISELDKRSAVVKSGKEKPISAIESKRRLNKILIAQRKK